MSFNVRSMIMEKSESKHRNRLVMKDVDRALIISLLAIPVYGKEARDEEILSVIINAGEADTSDLMAKIRENYNRRLKAKEIKKTKNGVFDADGFMVLVPRA